MNFDLSQLGIAGAVVVVVLAFIKLLAVALKFISEENKRRDEAQHALADVMSRNAEALNRNTDVGLQTFEYLKMRNGSGDRLMRELSDKLDKHAEIEASLVAKAKELNK